MSNRLSHHQHVVESSLHCLVIQCGTFEIFLECLRYGATVMVMPLERSLCERTGSWHRQYGVHLSARCLDSGRPLCYATFWAVEVRGAGSIGRLVSPQKEHYSDTAWASRAREHMQHLQQQLYELLVADPRVFGVRMPARYYLPDELVWGIRSALTVPQQDPLILLNQPDLHPTTTS